MFGNPTSEFSQAPSGLAHKDTDFSMNIKEGEKSVSLRENI